MTVTPDQLNGRVEFDSPFEVTSSGDVRTPLPGIYAPSVYEYLNADGQATGLPEIDGDTWAFVDGYSGQQGYSGPVMHPSEFLGGRMAADVLSWPGVYCLVAVTDIASDSGEDETSDASGWALLRRVVQ